MSLYELESMVRSLPELDISKPIEPTDDEWEEASALLASATANLPDVRI